MNTLTDLDRRAIANLSIPRNVDDLAHELRVDPYAPTQSSKDVAKQLETLSSRGLVVNLGEHDDMAKLAASVESHKQALTMPDEKAKIFSRRLSSARRRWRVKGDLWMLTDEGLDALHEPTVESPYLGMPYADEDELTARLQDIVDGEWARVAHDLPFNGSIYDQGTKEEPWKAGGVIDPGYRGGLAQKLLLEEFFGWAHAVTKEHEERTGQKIKLPIAGGAGWSDFYEAIILDAENQKSSITAAAPWYLALTTVAVTDADTGSTITEATYTGYARKSVAAADMNAGSGASGSVSNANAILFAACTAGTSTVIGVAHCVAATTGQVRKSASCASTVVSTTQTPAQVAAGGYVTSAD